MPTEIVELPSKGLLYSPDSPLSTGKVEMKYMGAKEEDILSNENYVQNGTVLDKVLESLTLGKINLKELYSGDKNAIIIAARILGYGKDYKIPYKGKNYKIDLTQINEKPFDTSLITKDRTVKFVLPQSSTEVEFKFLNEIDEDKIQEEIKGFKKLNPEASTNVTTRLKHTLVKVGGETDKNIIKNFVDNQILAQDSRALRNYIKEITPDIDLVYKLKLDNGDEEEVKIPINLTFFWPDLGDNTIF